MDMDLQAQTKYIQMSDQVKRSEMEAADNKRLFLLERTKVEGLEGQIKSLTRQRQLYQAMVEKRDETIERQKSFIETQASRILELLEAKIILRNQLTAIERVVEQQGRKWRKTMWKLVNKEFKELTGDEYPS